MRRSRASVTSQVTRGHYHRVSNYFVLGPPKEKDASRSGEISVK
jgi:hypothetical protein